MTASSQTVLLLNQDNESLIEDLRAMGLVAFWELDPNWPYEQTGGGDPRKFRSTAKQKYQEGDWMSIARTIAATVEVSRGDALMGMWVTCPLKVAIMRNIVMPLEAWGCWYYATTYYWRKRGAPGMGKWVRGDIEELMIFSRQTNGDHGRLPRRLREQMTARADRNVYECARHQLEHSEKPEDLMVQVLERFTLPGDLVGSLWSGWFPTGRACLRLGNRDCVGAELDPKRYDDGQQDLERVRAEMAAERAAAAPGPSSGEAPT